MEPREGHTEKDKRAFIKSRIAMYEGRAKLSIGMAPEHRVEEDDVYTQKQLAHYKAELASLLPPAKRRADLEETLRKRELYLKGQKEQVEGLEAKVREAQQNLDAKNATIPFLIEEIKGITVQLEQAKTKEGVALVLDGKSVFDSNTVAFIQSLPADEDDEDGIKSAVRHVEELVAKRRAKAAEAEANAKAADEARGSGNAKRSIEESVETDQGDQNDDGYGFTRVQWSDELPSIDEILPMPCTALPSKDAPPEVWESWRKSYETNMTRTSAQVASVKQTNGKLQRTGREGGYMCVNNASK